MCTCIYRVLNCLHCVFVLFRLCIFILICFDNCEGVLVICVLVFTVFCIVCTVFFIVSFMYIYFYLFCLY